MQEPDHASDRSIGDAAHRAAPHQARSWVAPAGALLALALWITLGFVIPLGAGWVHLLLPLGAVLLIRWVVSGPAR